MTDASEWLVGTAKRNPEALLVLAAGCALLLRGVGRSSPATGETAPGVPGANASWNVERTTERARQVAGDLKDRVTDTGASTIERAGETGRTLSTQAANMADRAQSMLSGGFGHLLREQPLAVVAVGLAAGAAVAALLPSTDLEERTLGTARDAISGMAGKVGEDLMAVTADAGQRLAQGVADRATEGLKELAQDVVGQVAGKVADITDKPSQNPGQVTPLPNRGI
jgi:hypothetical protein